MKLDTCAQSLLGVPKTPEKLIQTCYLTGQRLGIRTARQQAIAAKPAKCFAALTAERASTAQVH